MTLRRRRAPESCDAIRFIEGTLVNPETGAPFVLTRAERLFLSHAFDQHPDGRARYPELVFGAPKKSGKTTLAALCMIYAVRALGQRFAEGYVASNSREQAANRVFLAAARIVEASPLLRPDAKVTADRIVFRSTGATIAAISSDYSTAAGSNPTISAIDEPWAFTSELDHRLFDELVPPPTRVPGWRLSTTYAGFTGESVLLEPLYQRGLTGVQIAPDLYAADGLLMFWTHSFTAPWQTEDWREQMRGQLRPNQYLRMIENRWVTGEESFVPMEWRDACVDAGATPLRPTATSAYSPGSTPRPSATARRSWRAPTTAGSRRFGSSGTASSSPRRITRSTSRVRSSRRCASSPGAFDCARCASTRTRCRPWPSD
jgi:hypothetical protein